MDVRTVFDNDRQAGDLGFDGLLLSQDASFETAVLLSLFTDRRASLDEARRFGTGERRGWWGDLTLPDEGDQMGSGLWLLRREVQTTETLRWAEDLANQALTWLVTDGVATKVVVTGSFPALGVLALEVEIHLTDGAAWRQTFNLTLEN